MKTVQAECCIIKFTGEYKELKNMGYKFQKLFAGDYRQWRHPESQIRIYQRGADVEHDRLQSSFGYLLNMIIDGVKLEPRHKHVALYENQITNQLTTDSTVYNVGSKSPYGPTGLDFWQPVYLRPETIVMLKELLRRDWIHTETYVSDHWVPADILLDTL